MDFGAFVAHASSGGQAYEPFTSSTIGRGRPASVEHSLRLEHAGIGSGVSCLHQKDLGSRGVSIGRIEISDREPAFPRAKCATMSIGSVSPSSTPNPRSLRTWCARPCASALARKGGTETPSSPRHRHPQRIFQGSLKTSVCRWPPLTALFVNRLATGRDSFESRRALPTRPTPWDLAGCNATAAAPTARPRPGELSGWEMSTAQVAGTPPPS